MCRKQIRSEKGELLLEGAFSITVTLLVLVVLTALGFWLYQRCVTTIVVREIAEEAAVTYKLRNINSAEVTDAGEIDINDLESIGSYRYLMFGTDFKAKSEKTTAELADGRVRKANMAIISQKPKVTVERIGDDLGRTHYAVTLENSYTYFGQGWLKDLGLAKDTVVKSTVYVNSIDISDYFNTVKITKYALEKAASNDSVLKALNSVIKLIKSVADIFKPGS